MNDLQNLDAPDLFNITKEQTNIIKGIGILMVVFHNFFHLILPYTGQNEFSFSNLIIYESLSAISSNALDFFKVVFSYMGHYGVQLFIFISGYGLTLSYRKNSPPWLKFIRIRIGKLYPAFFLSAILLIVFRTVKNFHLPDLLIFKQIGLKLLFISNFIPGEALTVSGPWWFYSLIVQLYMLFPILNKLYIRYSFYPLALISIVSYSTLLIYADSNFEIFGLPIMTLFVGQLPVFCLGIIVANLNIKKFPNSLLFVASIVLIIGNFTVWLWPFINVSVVILLVAFVQFFVQHVNAHPLKKILTYYGTISMYLFACHGFMRNPFYEIVQRKNSVIIIITSLIFLAATTMTAEFLKRSEVYLRKSIYKS